jgi:hypothetical protein
LQGKHLSLKRSNALDGQHPDYISVLETLNIFAVKANYMSKFREYLEKEGIETEGDVELPLPIKPNFDFLDQGLVVPRVPKSRNFANEMDLLLQVDPRIQVNVDMSLKVQAMESSATGITATAVKTGGNKPIPQESLKYVDWENIYLELLDYKERKEMFNLAIKPNTPREIISQPDSSPLYNLIADDTIIKPTSFKDTALLNEAVLNILQKYMDTFYRKKQEKWDSEHMIYQGLEVKDANFQNYTVKIARSETQLITDVEKLIKKADAIYKQDLNDLPTVHFDRHLYQPLLIEQSNKLRSEPPGLKDSELKFVKDLREFFQQEKDASLAGKEIYLLRNLSRGKGVGFFEKRGFYPDFILWVKENNTQRIVFVEPHGMLFADAYQHDEKAMLHEILPTLGKEMAKRSGIQGVTLDSYIVSATSFNDLKTKYEDGSWDRQRFTEVHILFPERTSGYDYIYTLIN